MARQPQPREARRRFAEELARHRPSRDERVVDAFATVPRERFAGPGPWRLLHFADGYWTTPDADPRWLYHNVLVALDEERAAQYRRAAAVGAPLRPHRRAGRATACCRSAPARGYYTAILAELVGPTRPGRGHRDRRAAGRRRPQRNLEAWPHGPCPAGRRQPADRGALGRDRGLCRRHRAARLVARRAGRRRPPAAADDGRNPAARRLHAAARPPRRAASPRARPAGSASIPAPARAAPRTRRRSTQALADPAGQQAVRSLRRDPHDKDDIVLAASATAGASSKRELH